MTTFITRAAMQYARLAGARAMSGHAATAGGRGGGSSMWMKLSFFVAFPAIGLGMVNAYLGHLEHEHHDRPPFVAYEYMRVRTKRFPWGDGNKSLFHNPHVNALPNGYED